MMADVLAFRDERRLDLWDARRPHPATKAAARKARGRPTAPKREAARSGSILFGETGGILAAIVSLALSGCAAEPRRRPIEEIYREALATARLQHDPAEEAARQAGTARQPTSNRAPPPEPRPEPPGAKPAAPSGPLVSDTFQETDIREAILALAGQAGVQAAIDPAVRGTVVASFERVPFELALSDLLAAYGYVFERCEDRYVIGTTDPKSALFPTLAVSRGYAPRHLTTQELLEIVPKFALPYINVSNGRNLINVVAPRDLADRIVADLGHADRPVPQVVLEVIVCECSPQTKLDFGFDFDASFRVGGNTANAAMNNLALSGAVGTAGDSGLKSFDFYSALLHALAFEGYVSIRAAPRVMVRDGERAAIAIGQETYFTVSTEKFFFAQLQSVHSGIMLDLTPRIRGHEVSIRIERAEVSDEMRPSDLMSDGDGRLPTLNTRWVATTVSVRDGETIVIGGLVRRRSTERIARVPLLGDIPGLGLLFQKREERDEETEVAIFIAPRIVKEREEEEN